MIKYKGIISVILTELILCVILTTGCGSTPVVLDKSVSGEEDDGRIVIGFSQLGAESDWRSANSESMRSTFTGEKGYRLIFEDGQQKQSNQMTAIRTFIQQEVDYIVLAPVTETGWENVLEEARKAGIPVILMDRMVDVEDSELYVCHVGSDFELEGAKACEWLKAYVEKKEIDESNLHIANIQGTLGSTAQIGRTKGLSDAAKKYGWDLIAEVPGDFIQAKGREAMEQLLSEYEDINVVYCENDNEAMGAIEAIEAAGRHTGTDIENGDIMIISFDGVNEDALSLVRNKKISCIAECNPDLAPKIETVIKQLEKGETPQKLSYVDEELYSSEEDVLSINAGGREYKVTVLR